MAAPTTLQGEVVRFSVRIHRATGNPEGLMHSATMPPAQHFELLRSATARWLNFWSRVERKFLRHSVMQAQSALSLHLSFKAQGTPVSIRKYVPLVNYSC